MHVDRDQFDQLHADGAGLVRILVLEDGESWGGGGSLQLITTEQYDELCDGNLRIKDIEPLYFHEI